MIELTPFIKTTKTQGWKDLEKHFLKLQKKGINFREIFQQETDRVVKYTYNLGDLSIDFSKNYLFEETLLAFGKLVQELNFSKHIEEMFSGKKINVTENRAVLHTALRRNADDVVEVDGKNVIPEVQKVLQAMYEYANKIHSGELVGATGKKITNFVNIGIGGSDLGPRMVVTTLEDYRIPGVTPRFVSNIDPNDINSQLKGLDPEETLFIVVSKTFTTIETITNAKVAKQWILDKYKNIGNFEDNEVISHHFAAVSTNLEETKKFGIEEQNTFGFWNWVGGRFSLDSAVGLITILTIGPKYFEELLSGLRTTDEYFYKNKDKLNVISLFGLLNVWYTDFFQVQSHAVLPYSQRLSKFPSYLQQLLMESNGKSVKADGTPVDLKTSEIWWGEPGTNGQHAFYQLLHQGTRLVPIDFIGVQETNNNYTVDGEDMQKLFYSNLLAQIEALTFGKTKEEVIKENPNLPEWLVNQKVFKGNHPNTTIYLPNLSPATLGQLIALYEHITFIQGIVWEINSFDQFGVELGKQLAKEIFSKM